jgi:protein involved in polysaccharide export with SLBB domain
MDAKAYYNFGIKQARAKLYDEAIKAFQQAIQLRPDYTDAHLSLGLAYANTGRWQEAVETYEYILRIAPKDEEATYRLGEAYAKLRAQGKDNLRRDVGEPRGEKVGAVTNAVTAPDSYTSGGAAAAATIPRPQEGQQPPPDSSSAKTQLTSIYRVGPGDVLDVRLLNAPASQSTLYTVTSGGLLEYPLIGGDPLPVAGSTTDEIAARLTAELKRRALSENPEVIVGVREYTSHNVIVSGLVQTPGTKVLRREAVPLYVVIADAQPQPEAEEARIFSADGMSIVKLNDPEAMTRLVRPGDVITVQKLTQQFFYIGGQVSVPGQKRFHASMTLTQAILSSGGELSRGGNVKLLRQDQQGFLITTVYKIDSLTSGRVPDPLLQPNDRIEVTP